MSSVKWRPFCLGLNVIMMRTHTQHDSHDSLHLMMTSCNVNTFCITGPLWGESIDHRFPSQTASDAELWCFLLMSACEKAEQTVDKPAKTNARRKAKKKWNLIWDASLPAAPKILHICYLTHLPLMPHICVSEFGSALVQIMACRLFGAKPLSKPMLGYCQLDP